MEITSKHEIVNGHIIFQRIVTDDSPMHPLKDCDCMGNIYSFNRRHIDFVDPSTVDFDNPNIIPLSYFEHGLCKWGVAGSMSGMPDFQWDGVGIAGYWEPDKYLLEEAEKLEGEERQKKLMEWAEQACNVYTDYCNGSVYGVQVSAYIVRYSDSAIDGEDVYDVEADYRYDDAVFDESCYGYFGLEHAEEELESMVKWCKEDIAKESKKAG